MRYFNRLAIPGLVFIFLLLALPPGCSRQPKEPSQEPDKKYNVVLVVADALRRDALGCYGGQALTPNIDQLARTGVLFENAYATSPWTPPSSVSMFTGNYATTYAYAEFNKTVRVFVPDQEMTLAHALRDLGYATAIKNENPQAGIHNHLRGFRHLPKALRFDKVIPKDRKKVIHRQAQAVIQDNSAAYKDAFLVLDFLYGVPPGQNFFAAHWILDPHEPFSPVQKFMRRIKVDRTGLRHPARQYQSWKHVGGDISEAGVRLLKARYLAEVESVDERVGFILRLLEHKGVLDRTIFVFTSDHGELFGEHGHFGHRLFFYQDLVRVPLIMAGPGLPAGRRVSPAVSLLDLMPTLKDLLGVEYEENMQGLSMTDLIKGRDRRDEPIYFDDVMEHQRLDALLLGNFKLVALRDGGVELYNLADDPGELQNIASGHPETVQELRKLIEQHRSDNLRRQAGNLAAIETKDKEMSEEEKQKLLEKLKALGYVN